MLLRDRHWYHKIKPLMHPYLPIQGYRLGLRRLIITMGLWVGSWGCGTRPRFRFLVLNPIFDCYIWLLYLIAIFDCYIWLLYLIPNTWFLPLGFYFWFLYLIAIFDSYIWLLYLIPNTWFLPLGFYFWLIDGKKVMRWGIIKTALEPLIPILLRW